MRSTAVSYVFATPLSSPTAVLNKVTEIDYELPFPGKVLPDSMFWVFKVMRDKLWYGLSFSHLKKAELALLFSDKRLGAAKILFEKKKPDIALSTLSKSERYVEIATNEEDRARKEGVDTSKFLEKMTVAALKHRQVIEEEILPISPEDAKPEVIRLENYSKNAYKTSRDALYSKGRSVPINPFDRP
ncbi:MAG: hypothetical protein UT58_C0012G0003 [Microgenomates group bacterium GW2011_GWC1_39_7b]|nr:MAG: hypothetical protein UT58_C0012G0003 [Microgenomates group bacterium GW2011_GWC1_39_7b]